MTPDERRKAIAEGLRAPASKHRPLERWEWARGTVMAMQEREGRGAWSVVARIGDKVVVLGRRLDWGTADWAQGRLNDKVPDADVAQGIEFKLVPVKLSR